MRKFVVFMFLVSMLRATTVYQTDFENCSDSVPPGWILVDNNGDSHYFAAVNYSSAAHSGNWFIRYASYYANVRGDDWAISDSFYLQGNMEDTLTFYVRSWSTSYYERLRVYLLNGRTPSDTVSLLFRDDRINDDYYQLKTIVFRPPASGYYRIGFYSNSNPNNRAILVDDVTVMQADSTGSTLGNNLAIDAVSPYLSGWQSDREIDSIVTFTVTVKNYGTSTFNNTRVYYRVDSAGVNIVPETQIGRDNVGAGQTYIYTFNFSPSTHHMAEYDVYVYHNKSTDANNTYIKDDTFHMHFIVEGHQGKDAYGWIFRDSYSLLGDPNVSWIELNGDGNAEDLGLGDEGEVTRNLAGSIKFYGTDYSQIIIDPNGIISFDQEPADDFANDSIPSSNASIAIMPFWDDLDPSGGGAVYYKTISDTLTVIEWYQVPHYNGLADSSLTFEVQIQSNQSANGVFDNITFLYYDMHYNEDTMDATIGIQDGVDGYYLYYTYNEQPYVPDWKNTKGIFTIKFYAPEALGVNTQIAYNELEKTRTLFALHNAIEVAKYNPEKVIVFNMAGQRVPVKKSFKNGKLIIDFSSLKDGIYYINMYNKAMNEQVKIVNLK